MSENTRNPNDAIPLTPTVFHMLLALADGEKHGYAIMKAVEQDTRDKMKIRLGSLYGALQRMVSAGFIEEAGERHVAELDDQRRRYYQLTSHGKQVLRAESQRLSELVTIVKSKRILEEWVQGNSSEKKSSPKSRTSV